LVDTKKLLCDKGELEDVRHCIKYMTFLFTNTDALLITQPAAEAAAGPNFQRGPRGYASLPKLKTG